jgi:hypothetical protein
MLFDVVVTKSPEKNMVGTLLNIIPLSLNDAEEMVKEETFRDHECKVVETNRIIIYSHKDLWNEIEKRIDCSYYGYDDIEQFIEQIDNMDHPQWGDDWSEFLKTNIVINPS